jgi:hypothetical protein
MIACIWKTAVPVIAGMTLAGCTTVATPQYPASWNPLGYYSNGGGGYYAPPRTYRPPTYSYMPPRAAPDSSWSPIPQTHAEPAPATVSPSPSPLPSIDPPASDDGTCTGWWRICHFF